MSDNIDKPDYPMLTRVRVSWAPDAPDGYTGMIVYCPRWTAIGWEARVLPGGAGRVARWVPADRVSALSAVEQLAELLP